MNRDISRSEKKNVLTISKMTAYAGNQLRLSLGSPNGDCVVWTIAIVKSVSDGPQSPGSLEGIKYLSVGWGCLNVVE